MSEPSSFTSKPAACKAVKFDPDIGHPAVRCTHQGSVPSTTLYEITTRQGLSGIDPGDWIITEPDGAGFYPCKPAIFEKRWEEEENPTTDDLDKLGFKFCDDGNAMYLPLAVGGYGPELVVSIEQSQWSDNYLYAKSVSLYWVVQPRTATSGALSGSFGIRDNPTIGQIKALVAALKGE